MVKVNMMCGKRNFGEDWHHIDAQKYSHITGYDIFMKDWANDSIDLIYCSHGISYFDREEITPLLQAWKRALKPGGVLRLATPDARVIANLLSSVIVSTFADGIFAIELQKTLGPLYGKMVMDKETIYHKTVYDFNDICQLLNDCGFVGVSIYDHKKTEHAQYDDHSAAYINGKLISLNVECNK